MGRYTLSPAHTHPTQRCSRSSLGLLAVLLSVLMCAPLAVCTLRPASDLSSNCYGFPAEPFTPENHAVLNASIGTGHDAIDFKLQLNATEELITLSSLLSRSPVLLEMASYT
eukprot:TRINITY_DN1796_c0_g1_i1.p1 TRINITY_DN1796_c0_g1~~TRINITY_DN1796_c0_g1_i1.p1  ORF type:complete len:112 (-),score=28.11 TRINITY_DN1796_c0_g1_i1:930-1265(-)